jgi:N-acetylglucosaminyl-diphospho-decaprenol L-rhamnosyltransferase
MPSVSVVVLSHNRPALLGEALDSVLAQTYREMEVTVVDNPSPSSAEVARVASARGGVRLLANRSNEGYTGGMNRGLRGASAPYVLLTEDDIVLEPDCVARLVAHMEAHPSIMLAAPVILNRGAGTIRCAGAEVTLGGVYRKRVYGAGEADAGQFREPFEVGQLDGAVLLARADFLRALGGFREEFFMYAEVVELCLRATKAGGRLAVVPRARVSHFEPRGGEAGAAGLDFHRLKNFFALYLLHAPARVLPEFCCRYVLLGALRTLSGRGAARRAFFSALWWAARRAPSLWRERGAGARSIAALRSDAGVRGEEGARGGEGLAPGGARDAVASGAGGAE